MQMRTHTHAHIVASAPTHGRLCARSPAVSSTELLPVFLHGTANFCARCSRPGKGSGAREPAKERASERQRERKNRRQSERTKERASERVSERASRQARQSERASERASEQASKHDRALVRCDYNLLPEQGGIGPRGLGPGNIAVRHAHAACVRGGGSRAACRRAIGRALLCSAPGERNRAGNGRRAPK